MREYELVLVVDSDLTSEERKKSLDKVKKIIEESKGKVSKTEDWGRKQLAYPIKKKEMGYYLYWQVELDEKAIAELDKNLRMEEGIIRFLLARAEKLAKTSAKKGKGG